MLTSSEKSTYSYAKKLASLPLSFLVAGLLIISCQAKDKEENAIADQPAASVSGDSALIQPPTVADTTSTYTTESSPAKPGKEPVFKDEKGNIVPGPEIFVKVEKDAEYPGGHKAWRSYLERNLSTEVPGNNGAPAGNHTIIAQFVVDVNGNVSNIKALNDPGYGMAAEVVRVINRSGKWKPAMQNGKPVKAYRKQPVTFQVLEE